MLNVYCGCGPRYDDGSGFGIVWLGRSHVHYREESGCRCMYVQWRPACVVHYLIKTSQKHQPIFDLIYYEVKNSRYRCKWASCTLSCEADQGCRALSCSVNSMMQRGRHPPPLVRHSVSIYSPCMQTQTVRVQSYICRFLVTASHLIFRFSCLVSPPAL